MILKHITAKNFYSFKELDLDLTKFKNIVYVKGINKDSGGSNGSGKSSILEMITWGLFGKTIRKSTEDALINCDSRKALEVVITIEKPGVGVATITRGKRPNILNFSVDGQELTQENALKTQDHLEKVLGLSYKTFVASIVFGQHVDLEFLDASAEDKRTIIRNFLNLDEIFSMRDKIKDLKSEFNNCAKIAATLIGEYSSQETKLKAQIDTKIDKVELPETLEQVEAREQEIKDHGYDLSDLNDNLRRHIDDVETLDEIINNGVFSKKEICKTCKKSYIKKQTKAAVKRAEKNKKVLGDSIIEIKKTIQIKQNLVKDLSKKLTIKQWYDLNNKRNLFLSQKKIRDEYNEALAKKQAKELEKHNCEVNYEIMKFWEKAFSEQGIIKYFIRNILDYLNFKTNEYLSILTNNQFTIFFNEELDETIVNNGRKLSYMSLSGGEKRKINLSVMLALQSLLTHTSKEQSNIIFFDEIAENMDEDGCAGVHNLLKSLKEEDKTIFLITHNAYLKSLLDGCQILTVVKKNGESKIIEN
tara:strand:- start:3732 stop:5324 length:1593 start_codon:yes stop_codon:yes gene_type:complete